jgi:hypothetical protein
MDITVPFKRKVGFYSIYVIDITTQILIAWKVLRVLKGNGYYFPTYRKLCEQNEKDYRDKVKNCKDRKRHYNFVKVSNFGTVSQRCSSTGEAQLLCHINNGVVKLLVYPQHTCPCKTYLWLQLEISTHTILQHHPWPSHLLLSTTDCLYQTCNMKSNCRVSSNLSDRVPCCLPNLVDLHPPSLQQSLSELLAKNRRKGKTVSGQSQHSGKALRSTSVFV